MRLRDEGNMKIISRILTIILFVIFFGFALKNDQIVTLYYFFGYAQSAPLVIMLLVFFLAGAVLGVLAMVPIVFKHRRALSAHKKTLAEIEKERLAMQKASMQPPATDHISST
jgi:uncharacterized integral membrane protein